MKTSYPGLFLRMALYIGAALGAFVLVGAASLGLIAAWELRGYIETRQSTLGEQAAEILANGGEQALTDWLENDAAIPVINPAIAINFVLFHLFLFFIFEFF